VQRRKLFLHWNNGNNVVVGRSTAEGRRNRTGARRRAAGEGKAARNSAAVSRATAIERRSAPLASRFPLPACFAAAQNEKQDLAFRGWIRRKMEIHTWQSSRKAKDHLGVWPTKRETEERSRARGRRLRSQLAFWNLDTLVLVLASRFRGGRAPCSNPGQTAYFTVADFQVPLTLALDLEINTG
jgi:hypothetical protein